MKAIDIALIINDEKLEGRIAALENRCAELNISLSSILQAVSPKVPSNPYVDVLLSFADLEIYDIERSQRMKNLFNGFIKRKKGKEENK